MLKNIDLKHIKETSWYRQAANSKAYYIYAASRAAIDSMGASWGFMCIHNIRNFEWFCEEKFFVKSARMAILKEKKNAKWIDDIEKKCKEIIKRLENFYSMYNDSYIRYLNRQETCSAITELEKIVYDFWKNIYICDWFDPQGEELLRDEINKTGIIFDTYEISVLLRTTRLNYAQIERLEFLNLALIKNKRDKIFKKKFDQHIKKYFYIDNSWESTKILGVKDFNNKLKDILTLQPEEIRMQINDIKMNWTKLQEGIYKKYHVPQSLKNVFYLFRTLAYLRDVRKEYTLLTNHYFDTLYTHLGRLLDIPFSKFGVCLPSDLHGDLNNLEKNLDERSDNFVELYGEGVSTFFYGSMAEKVHSALQKSFTGEVSLLQGFAASPGKVRGVVRVVMGETHFGKFNEGEILVAPMTRPEYLPLMKKALAIITDEGGLTSHAAIIARELKVPCLIGTKNATKVLKDGDLVEINTNHNQLKIIKD